MTAPVTVRRALPEDLPLLSALAGRLVRMHHEVDPGRFFLVDDVEKGYAAWFARELKRREAVLLVAVAEAGSGIAGSAIAGYSYGAFESRDWNLLLDEHGAIHDIFVLDSERQRGAGQLLMTAMVEALEALGAKRIILSTMVSNERAQRLFARAGFRPTMLEMTRGG